MQYEAALAAPRYVEPLRLPRHGRKVLSQNDEDGLIQEIFRRIGVRDRRFVEIGVSNGLECNTAALLLQGWSGAWIEVDAACAQSAAQSHHAAMSEGRLRIVCARATPATVEDQLARLDIPHEFDLLSIDIDGNDYWLWQAVRRRPRVVVIEYNAAWAPPLSITCPLDDARVWDGTSYFGASLTALERLGLEKGYRLVGCGYAGVNAFLVREDLADPSLFAAPFTAENHFEPPRYELGQLLLGHPPGVGPVVEIAPGRRDARPAGVTLCRLCHGTAARVFERLVLGRHQVGYFRCDDCASVFTETPYWLDEAYHFPGVHIDIGMAHRAIRNWLALTRMLPLLSFSAGDRGVDYGGGTGLLTRLLRDAGFDFLTLDRFRPSYFADMYEAIDLKAAAPRIITAFEVFEHFSDPSSELAAILDAGSDLIVFSTSFCDNQNYDTWDYLVPECGQHVFFYSRKGFEAFCSARGYDYVHGTFLQALVRRQGPLEDRKEEVAANVSLWNLPDAHVVGQVQHVIRGNEHISREATETRLRFSAMLHVKQNKINMSHPELDVSNSRKSSQA